MAILEKTRSEIDDNYKWNIKAIYETEELWEKDLKEVSILIKPLGEYKGKVLDSAHNLYHFITMYLEVSRKLEKLYMYAHLNYDSETCNTEYQRMQKKIENIYDDFSITLSFFNPELLTADYSKIESFYNDIPELKQYEKIFIDIFRYKEHTLSKDEENLLSKLGSTLSAPSDIYENMTDTDLKFGTIIDDNDEEVEITDSNYSLYIRSKNRRVRKDAFTTLYKGYIGLINSITATFTSHVKMECIMADIKKYNSAMEASLFDDNVSTEVYNNLVETVSQNLEPLFKYYKIKKNILNVSELHFYDLYVDLIENDDKKYTFEEAKDIVLKALKPLGDKYVKDLENGYNEGWVDVYSNKGKRSGAYSSGGYDTFPYILLNYQGNLDDVSTLAHESGHSMHSLYSRQNNPYHEANYEIFVAEVASTVNELLLCKYLLNNTDDKKVKLSILNKMIELFKGTIFRQTMFAEFEKLVHEKIENKEVLTHDMLCQQYLDLNKKYFGNTVVYDNEIKYEWERIPHFYYNFYVYKYATGLSSACYIVSNILDKKEGALENYIEFLKQGGRDYPVEELKIAGVDITKKEVIESAIKMFKDTVDEFEKIYYEK